LNWTKKLKKVVRKIVGWTLVIFSVFSFMACFILLGRGDLGSFVTGLTFSLFILVLGWSIQADSEQPRKRIIALIRRYLPQCPICKSEWDAEDICCPKDGAKLE